MEKEKKPYGYELILDLHGCDVSKFNRTSLDQYFEKLCKAIDMKRCDLHFWDDEGLPPERMQTQPHTKGTSAVQFIITSTIVVHTLDLLKAAYINIFSCKGFDEKIAEKVTREWFSANGCRAQFIERI
jgi:S-adenosylmethionine/arginine decarboxylase-like enzyme